MSAELTEGEKVTVAAEMEKCLRAYRAEVRPTMKEILGCCAIMHCTTLGLELPEELRLVGNDAPSKARIFRFVSSRLHAVGPQSPSFPSLFLVYLANAPEEMKEDVRASFREAFGISPMYYGEDGTPYYSQEQVERLSGYDSDELNNHTAPGDVAVLDPSTLHKVQ